MDMMSPVFLVAPVRSGSTLLRLMLDHHPRINNPGECDFLFDYVSDTGSFPPTSKYELDLINNRIYQSKELVIDSLLSYEDLMMSFMRQFSVEGKTLILNIHRNFHRVPQLFPKARYIHLLRDPRDVARSCMAMGWVGHVYFGVDIWKTAEDSWDRLKASLDQNQYLEVHYENLLEDVKIGLTEICEFLDLSYSDDMLTYPDHTTYNLPDSSLCYQWKKKYNRHELQIVEGKLGGAIIEKGYQLSGFDSIVPGLVDTFTLRVKNKFFKVKYQVIKYGLFLYLSSLIARRFGMKKLENNCQKRKDTIDIRGLI